LERIFSFDVVGFWKKFENFGNQDVFETSVEKYKGYMCSKEGRLSVCGFKNMFFLIYIDDCFPLEFCFVFEFYYIVTFFFFFCKWSMNNSCNNGKWRKQRMATTMMDIKWWQWKQFASFSTICNKTKRMGMMVNTQSFS
jgi:hypothetical protein